MPALKLFIELMPNKMYKNYHAHTPMMFWIGQGVSKQDKNGDWFEKWWVPYIGPIEGVLNQKDIEIFSEACAVTYLENGITEVWDMYFHEEVVAESLSQYGIRTYADEVIMSNESAGYTGDGAINETIRLIEKYDNHDLIKPVVGYIGPYAWASNEKITKKKRGSGKGIWRSYSYARRR